MILIMKAHLNGPHDCPILPVKKPWRIWIKHSVGTQQKRSSLKPCAYTACICISNHRKLKHLFNRLFRLSTKKISKAALLTLWEGNPPVDSPHKGTAMRKAPPCHDVIMIFGKTVYWSLNPEELLYGFTVVWVFLAINLPRYCSQNITTFRTTTWAIVPANIPTIISSADLSLHFILL